MTDERRVLGHRARYPRGGREIGPLGTAARILAGGATLFLLVLTDGVTVWNLAAGLVGLPLVAILALRGLRMPDPGSIIDDGGCPTDRGLPCSADCLLLALVTVLVVAVSFVTPTTEGAILIWLGVSFLLASFLGYRGCEMVAIPNLLTGRQDRMPCFLFIWIDRAEADAGQMSDAH